MIAGILRARLGGLCLLIFVLAGMTVAGAQVPVRVLCGVRPVLDRAALDQEALLHAKMYRPARGAATDFAQPGLDNLPGTRILDG